jgi:hypothetical protein
MSYGNKLKVYQSAAFKVKDPPKIQKGERPPVAIRLQLNDINESLVSPKAPLQNTVKPATPTDTDVRGTFEIVQSYYKPKSQKRNSANPSK